jgi:hypothetical protein
VCN